MNHEERNLNNRGYNTFRGTVHIGMGGLYVAIAVIVIYLQSTGTLEISKAATYGFSILAIIYGLFRMWRGWTYIRNKG